MVPVPLKVHPFEEVEGAGDHHIEALDRRALGVSWEDMDPLPEGPQMEPSDEGPPKMEEELLV